MNSSLVLLASTLSSCYPQNQE